MDGLSRTLIALLLLAAVGAPMPAQLTERGVSSTGKLVFAHFMLAYPTGNDQVGDYKGDITRAQNYNIDGFALNMGALPQDEAHNDYLLRADKLYQAAAELGTGFKLFISADTSSLVDPVLIQHVVTRYASHPNQLFYNGKQFLSTFLGQDAPFDWQTQVLNPLSSSGNPVYFMPNFVVSGDHFLTMTIFLFEINNLDLAFRATRMCCLINTRTLTEISNGFPGKYIRRCISFVPRTCASQLTHDLRLIHRMHTTPLSQDLSEDTLFRQYSTKAGKTFMQGIAPWFFCHLSDKNWGNIEDGHILVDKWESILTNNPDFVEFVTWNDFSESTYVAPPNSVVVNRDYPWGNFDHTAFLELSSYYHLAFKTGQKPAITAS
ncbi:glycosyl hydrolase family 71-domain-containing protein [Jimgerdemannia flammicorona]|uniref:Glycosyl hydrolase family 71-domain-containing protein n=1 Tax=Jimgerdemannia flammicorona TaxID=994334 RepID=A0A433Q6S4_9FUNG|nr:glycosyl hydrolase family 71-domain-containing protein [Jimgerdemannia flammicorona]